MSSGLQQCKEKLPRQRIPEEHPLAHDTKSHDCKMTNQFDRSCAPKHLCKNYTVQRKNCGSSGMQKSKEEAAQQQIPDRDPLVYDTKSYDGEMTNQFDRSNTPKHSCKSCSKQFMHLTVKVSHENFANLGTDV